MARLMAVANGNNTDTATWALINSTAFLESETANTALTTSYVASSAFTPGAITIDGIAVRIASRAASPTGTISVELYNSTGAASVAGTEVTINVSDLPLCTTTDVAGGWAFFKFASSVLLLAATNYQVRARTSSATQVNLFRDGTAGNWSRMLRTTTTQAPAATDDRFIMGEWTGAGAQTTRTVTINDTGVAVDYGSASTSQVTPALSISKGGEFKSGLAASTAYVQRISGNTVVYSGGVLRLADTTTRMPTTSSLTWTNDCVANVDFGIDVRNGGAMYGGGESKQRWTLLSVDEAAAQTVIGLVSTSGWKVGDELVFAPTGTTITQAETKTILTVDSATQVTLTAGLTFAHTGTGDVVGEVGNLTSNVTILGVSSTVGTFVCFRAGSTGNLDNVKVKFFGSGTSNKTGVEALHINTSSNSVTFTGCVFSELSNASGAVSLAGGLTSGAFFYVTNCLICSLVTSANNLTLINGGAVGTPTFNFSNCIVLGNGGGNGVVIRAVTSGTGTITNVNIAGFNNGLSLNSTYIAESVLDFSGFFCHSNSQGAVSTNPGSIMRKMITSCRFFCNQFQGSSMMGGVAIYESCSFIGNGGQGFLSTTNVSVANGQTFFNSCVFRGRTSFNQPSGYQVNGNYQGGGSITFNSCSFGGTVAHTVADVNIIVAQGGRHTFNNCTFASTTEFNSTIHTFLDEFGIVGVQRRDTTAGDHRTFVRQGIATRDTTIFNTASPSLRLEPKSATIEAVTKLFPFSVPVNSGQTCTPTVQVRESVVGDGTDYNGNRIKLFVAANYNLGITSDTLLDTATASSVGAWEALTGTTASATDDGVMEFYLTCDGTTGWINVDDFTATVA